MTVSLVSWPAVIGIFNCRISIMSKNCESHLVLKLLTRLRLGSTHLNEHKFRHNFQDCLNPLCSCSLEIEDTSHYLLHGHHFSNHRIDLMNSVNLIIPNFESMNNNIKKDILLYGDSRFDENKTKIILEATINFLKNSERFSRPLFE